MSEKRDGHPLHHCVMNAISEFSSSGSRYLCTGLDLYVTHEPCVMCSMACVHGRIKRVFIGVSDKERGGLGDGIALQCNKKLNHRFQVWRGFLYDEISEFEKSCFSKHS